MSISEFDQVRWSIHSRQTSMERNADEAKQIAEIIKKISRKTKRKYKTLLDVPCGTGRIDGFLRKYRYDVYGVDINSRFISTAKQSFPKYRDHYTIGNLKSFDLKRKFDVIVCWFTSFGYLNEKGNSDTLKMFSKHLESGGLLILDVAVRTGWKNFQRGYGGFDESPNFIRLVITSISKKDNKKYLIHSSRIYKKSKKKLRWAGNFRTPIRLYESKEITKLLQKNGIRILYKVDRRSMGPIDKNSRNGIFVGIKRN